MSLAIKKIRKNWFTMLELIFACTVFAMLVSGIVLAINRSYEFMNNTRVQIRATNLSREGVEMMFNIRDTNRRKCSWQRDQFWLYLGFGANTPTHNYESECDPNGKLFQEWIYAIKEWESDGDRFTYAEKLNIANIDKFYSLDEDWFFSSSYDSEREKTRVTFTWVYRYWSWSAEEWAEYTWEIADLLWNGVEFYRIARVYWIYCKTANNSNQPVSTVNCNKISDPKEMRFCVKTFYKFWAWTHSSELCSIMTNFME